jgi:hypothetical protein
LRGKRADDILIFNIASLFGDARLNLAYKGGEIMKMTGVWSLACVFILCFVLMPAHKSAFADSSKIEVGKTYYLKCNLHADPNNNRLSSVNYQLTGKVLKWGTPIKIKKISRGKVKIEASGEIFTYEIHKRTKKVTTVRDHLARFLTTDLNQLKTKAGNLSSMDKKGIEDARAIVGMSKQGVLIAIGYPPEFVVPDPMAASSWQFWRNRWGQFVVIFDQQGRVKDISGNY